MRAVAGLVENLSEIIEGNSPTIGARHPAAKKSLQAQRARAHAPDRGAVEPRDTPRCLDARHRMQPLGEPQATIRAVADTVYQLVGIAHTKAREDHPPLVRPAVAVRVTQMEQLIEITDVDAPRPRLDSLYHG